MSQTQLKKLEAALRNQALTPEFSEALHERIMQRLRQEARRSGAAPLPRNRFSPLWRWTSAAAAVLVVGGGIWMIALLNAAKPQQVAKADPVPPLPSLARVNDLLPAAVGRAQTQMEETKYAYLDRDARRFAGFVLSQMPGGRE